MSGLFLLTRKQMSRIKPYFPLSHGVARVDDRGVLSGIIYVIRNGLQWKDAPRGYGPHKTLYNRFVRWNRMGVFNKIFPELAGQAVLMRCEACKLQTVQDHFHGQRCLHCREDPPDDLERRHAHKSHDKACE